jgi:hypothetical protein
MDEQVFMVVMSLVKSPIAVIVQMGNTQAQAFFPAGCALMFDAAGSEPATKRMFLRASKTP